MGAWYLFQLLYINAQAVWLTYSPTALFYAKQSLLDEQPNPLKDKEKPHAGFLLRSDQCNLFRPIPSYGLLNTSTHLVGCMDYAEHAAYQNKHSR